jgi:hypothetical protein
MMVLRRCSLIIVGILICFGCASAGPSIVDKSQPPQEGGQKVTAGARKSPEDGNQKLSAGIKSYEDGNYQDAAKLIQAALNTGLRDKESQVKAHKYLAFIHCSSDKKRECAEEFRKALELDPSFELQATEAGHPLWGPVYASVKGAPKTTTEVRAKSPSTDAAGSPSMLAPRDAHAAELRPGTSSGTLVVVKRSNFRAEADEKSKILRVLNKGEKLEYLGKSESGKWFHCKLLPSGPEGWIFNDLVE